MLPFFVCFLERQGNWKGLFFYNSAAPKIEALSFMKNDELFDFRTYLFLYFFHFLYIKSFSENIESALKNIYTGLVQPTNISIIYITIYLQVLSIKGPKQRTQKIFLKKSNIRLSAQLLTNWQKYYNFFRYRI